MFLENVFFLLYLSLLPLIIYIFWYLARRILLFSFDFNWLGIFADVGIDLVGVDVGDTSLELLKSINSLNDL